MQRKTILIKIWNIKDSTENFCYESDPFQLDLHKRRQQDDVLQISKFYMIMIFGRMEWR